jgi:uncharacterized protein (DUF779 family)
MRALLRIENRRWAGVLFCVSSLCCESSAFLCGLGTSASATGDHDLLREEELVDFLAVGPRLDDAEPDDVFFAAGRGRLGDDSLDVDFFAAGRGRLDLAVGAGFFAGLLAGPDAD